MKIKTYYQRNRKKELKRIRRRRLLKRFGFIPKIYLYNKDVTSDGCFMGNSKMVLKHLNNQDMLKKVAKKHHKAIWVYKVKDKSGDKFKIQIADVNTNEEYWIRFNGTSDKLIEFFNKLKGYPVNWMKNWEREGGKNETNKKRNDE